MVKNLHYVVKLHYIVKKFHTVNCFLRFTISSIHCTNLKSIVNIWGVLSRTSIVPHFHSHWTSKPLINIFRGEKPQKSSQNPLKMHISPWFCKHLCVDGRDNGEKPNPIKRDPTVEIMVMGLELRLKLRNKWLLQGTSTMDYRLLPMA